MNPRQPILQTGVDDTTLRYCSNTDCYCLRKTMYIERTHYHAKPGRREAVRRARERACDVRVELGLKRGTILYKSDADDDGPDVVWAGSYGSEVKRLPMQAFSPGRGSRRPQMPGRSFPLQRHRKYRWVIRFRYRRSRYPPTSFASLHTAGHRRFKQSKGQCC